MAGPGWWRVAAVPVAVRRGTRHLCRLKYTGQSKHRNNHSAKCFLHLTWIIDCTDCTAQCHQDQPVDISRPAVGSRSGCPVASIVYMIKYTLPLIILQKMWNYNSSLSIYLTSRSITSVKCTCRELCAGENKIVKQEILSSFEV